MRAMRGYGEKYHSIVHRTLTLLRTDRDQLIQNLVEQIEGHFSVKDLRPACQALTDYPTFTTGNCSLLRGCTVVSN